MTKDIKPASEVSDESASRNITERIRELGDWRGERLAQVRALIHEADPDVVEEWKWMGTPVWSHDGILCTGEALVSCPASSCHCDGLQWG